MDFLLQNLAIFLGLIFFACLSWRKIEYGIYAIVICLPLYLAKLSVFGIPSTALELGIYVLFAIWLTKKILNFYELRNSDFVIPSVTRNHRQMPENRAFARDCFVASLLAMTAIKKILKINKFLFLGIFLLLFGALISTVFSSDLKTSAGILKGWFFDPFLFFIILIAEIKTLKQKENILKALFFSGLMVAIISLFYWLGFLSDGVSYDGRLRSFYLSPNYLAMYLSPALIAGIWLFLKDNLFFKSLNIKYAHPLLISPSRVQKGEKEKRGYFWFILIFIISITLYLTYSYAAWLAIFFAVIVLLYFMSGNDKKLSFLIIFLIFIVLLFSQIGTNKFQSLKNFSYRSSYNSRLMIWQSAWEIGKDNWLIGIGPGNFQKYYLEYQARFTEPYLEWAVPQPHNIFLAFWLETGILGLSGFVVILAWFFNLFLRNFKLYLKVKIPPDPLLQRKEQKYFPPLQRGIKGDLTAQMSNLQDKENYLLTAVLFSLMIYTLTHGLFDTTYWKNDLAVIFWLNSGLILIRFSHLTFRI